ncbi:uncharacterized protein LACBIDRAFT_331134 [Laccaria bicolor S238N-H82]|uniref:Predicted protein n=1 Tax=Laccaria bicolor (strain S238N-H82 / ATCC MYA-4686) TaxID=486041 RepID=B0DNK6_LACBS|nr:uncharacterized protein LACBIDRAFT_331134 [Laccaria bicolor S238N-H82]EDR03882.1 predicted protein [Laccaria bicolor S238N-H82]|eukprot:XP_001885450.1 predicted protein [Laccaria bicolor S238N-H82]
MVPGLAKMECNRNPVCLAQAHCQTIVCLTTAFTLIQIQPSSLPPPLTSPPTTTNVPAPRKRVPATHPRHVTTVSCGHHRPQTSSTANNDHINNAATPRQQADEPRRGRGDENGPRGTTTTTMTMPTNHDTPHDVNGRPRQMPTDAHVNGPRPRQWTTTTSMDHDHASGRPRQRTTTSTDDDHASGRPRQRTTTTSMDDDHANGHPRQCTTTCPRRWETKVPRCCQRCGNQTTNDDDNVVVRRSHKEHVGEGKVLLFMVDCGLIQLESTGIHWIPQDSAGFHWIPVPFLRIPPESGPIPPESAGMTGVRQE